MISASERGKLSLVRPETLLGSTVVFLGGGRAYTVDDAVADAAARGALDDAIEETLALSAAEQHAEEEGVDIEEETLQQSSEKYRYDHDLISAGETEQWLAARALALDDFAGWLFRRLCADAVARRPSADVPEDFPDLLRIHLWFSHEMDRLAEQFRRRIAAQLELAGENLSLDAAYDRVVRSVLTDEARRRKLATMRLSLTRLELNRLELASEAAAREACLCVRNDGETLGAVAADAGYPTKREQIWIEDSAHTVSPQLSFAGEGEIVGPIHSGDRYQVVQIVRRIEPKLADRDVAARIDQALLDEHFTELCARHTQLPVVARTAR